MDQNKQNMGEYPSQGAPPSYNQAVSAYPTQQGGVYPALNDGYPVQQGGYPAQQGGYVAQGGHQPPQVGYVAQGAYPTTTVNLQQQPIAKMEKDSVMTICTGCNNQVITSVNDTFNNNGIAWIIYSVCCGGLLYLLFLLCIEGFKTFTHKCPACGKILTQFTPQMSGGAKAALICAVCCQMITLVFIIAAYASAGIHLTSAASSYSYSYNSFDSY